MQWNQVLALWNWEKFDAKIDDKLVPSKSMSAASAEGLHRDNDDDPDEEAYIAGQASSGDGGDDNYCCVSGKVYGECGNKKKVLYLMCIGLKHRNNNSNEEQPLFSFEQETWSLLA